MTRLRSFSGLKWVSTEINETIRKARDALEEYVEGGGETAVLGPCIEQLHQVRGVLDMLQLVGPARLAEEMQLSAEALREQSLANPEEAAEALMLSMIQLPDYLEKLESSGEDMPVLLLPAINDLRLSRNAVQISDFDLVVSNMMQQSGGRVGYAERAKDLRQLAIEVRPRLHKGLLNWFRGVSAEQGMAVLRDVFAELEAEAVGEALLRGVFRTTHAVIEGLLDQSIDSSTAVKGLVGRVDRVVKQLGDQGVAAAAATIEQSVVGDLLKLLAKAQSDNPVIRAVQADYGLNAAFPGEQELDLGRRRMHAPNADALTGIRSAAVKELLPIKDTLDLYMRGGKEQVAQLSDLEGPMMRLASTLDMTGLVDLAQRLRGRAADLKAIASGEASADDALLMRVASDLLYVESSLDNVLQADGESKPLGQMTAASAMPQGEIKALIVRTLDEAAVEMAKAKDAIVVYIDNPGDSRPLETTPSLFHNIAGVLRVIDQNNAAKVLDQISAFVQQALLRRSHSPETRTLDALADAITSIEYYMEAVAEDRSDAEDILQGAHAALAHLVQDAPPLAEAEQVTATDTPPASVALENAEAVSAPSPATAVVVPESIGLEQDSDQIDLEILEIFIEEAREEEPLIRQHYQRWRANPLDSEALTNFRRSFHTLKGSGRLAGAMTIGEFSWTVENLLNHIINQTLALSDEAFDFLDQAVAVLPDLIDAQEQGYAPEFDVDAFIARGQDLSESRNRAEAVTDEPDSTLVEVEYQTDDASAASETADEVIEWPEDDLAVEDSELRDIFEAEALEHLHALQDFLQRCVAQAPPHPLNEEVVRSLHTLAGSARMTGLEPIAVVAKALERKGGALLEARIDADTVYVDLLREGVVAISSMVDHLRHSETPIPGTDALLEKIDAYALTANLSETAEDAGEVLELTDFLAAEMASSAASGDGAAAHDELPLDWREDEIILADDIGQAQAPSALADESSVPLHVDDKAVEPETVLATFDASPSSAVESLEAPSELAPAALVDAAETALLVEPPPPAPEMSESEADYETLSVDPELRDIFLEESEELLDRLDEGLRAWVTDPEDAQVSQQLQRTLHTLKGSARLAGIQSIGNLSHALETLVQRIDAGGGENPFGGVLAQRAADRLSDQVAAVRQGLPVPLALAMVAALEAPDALDTAQSDAPAVAASAEPAVDDAAAMWVEEEQEIASDPELVEIFLEEASDLIDQLDSRLRAWEGQPEDGEAPVQMKRTLHTLKGGARLAGIPAIGDLSHALESLLEGVTPEMLRQHASLLPLAQRAADRLAVQVEAVRDSGTVQTARELISELEYMHEELLGGGASHAPLAEIAAVPSRPASPKPVQASPPAAAATRAGRPPASQEQVRVRSDVLNRLVNHAGEISIYRARLEQQNTTLGFNLGELEQTVARLHNQLRQMEIETEAQILYRYEQERDEGKDPEDEFDPLELDRFSTIQQLSRSLIETVNDLSSIKGLLGDQQKESETLLLQHSRISNDLQDGLLRTRMVPFSQLVPRLHRLVRQTADSLNKRAMLEVIGAEGEMDRSILDRMLAPMEHILRNAISHGIETPETRRAAGKDVAGRITIYLNREGNDVVIIVSDDGAGLNLEAIRRRAIETGLLASGAIIKDDDLMQLVLEPGFSTVRQVTQISGRGVGTDVVVSEVKQMGGSLEIDSQPGRGTSFSIRLPFTLAISEALLVELGEDVFAVPHPTIEGVVRINSAELARCYAGEQQTFQYAGHDYDVRYLGNLIATVAPNLSEGRKWLPLLLVRSGEHRVAIQVDRILGNRQIVVKSVGAQLSSVRWISGGTILADGRVALILDVSALVRMDVVHSTQSVKDVLAAKPEQQIKVMVVDDSITVRKVTTRLLKRHNMEVSTAKDGVDAVAQLQELHPDVMLLDIEMPRMDGYELARHMRNTSDLSDIPIIMITSRSGEKHRNLALSLGVKRYLGKPYQEADLLDNIYAILAENEVGV
jgi:chemosensory pili system protein ChpA (sensor histidine kinase/response regulator)